MTMPTTIDGVVAPAHALLWRLVGPILHLSRESATGEDHDVEILRPASAQRMITRLRFWAALAWTVLIEVLLAVLFMSVGMSFAYRMLDVIARLMPSWWDLFLIVAAFVPIALALPGLLLIQLRYDQTWYALGSKYLRVHEGLGISRESTVSYTNIQNVALHQGPMQRLAGIGDLIIRTAGGKGGKDTSAGSKEQGAPKGSHVVRLRGIENPRAVHKRILLLARGATTNDGPAAPRARRTRLGGHHLEALHAIRREARLLRGGDLGATA